MFAARYNLRINLIISVCALQETEILIGFPERILNCGHSLVAELEPNASKKRVGSYIRNDVKRNDLEKLNFHIIDIECKIDRLRIINVLGHLGLQGG